MNPDIMHDDFYNPLIIKSTWAVQASPEITAMLGALRSLHLAHAAHYEPFVDAMTQTASDDALEPLRLTN